LLAVIALAAVLMNRTSVGRQIYAMGSNMDAAGRMGFHLLRLHFFVYCFMGMLAGIAGLVQAQLVQTVAPNSIVGRELEVVAAVILGGASLAGGAGTVFGTVLGVTLIAVMQNGLALLGVSSYWHKVVIGLIILASVSITAYNQKLEERRYAKIDV
jgi:simple sugar transport system permease protein